MMRKVFFFCLVTMLCLTANAQKFGGNHPLQLSATGSASQTSLTTNQVVSYLSMPANTWEILFKTETMTFGANPTQLQILNNVFLASTNRLMQLDIDIQSAGFNFNNNFNLQNLNLMGQLTFNKQVIPVPLTMNISYDKATNEVTYSLQGNFNLSNLGLTASSASANFGNQVTIATNGVLTPR